MSKTVLFTRPNYDVVTNYLYFWSTDLISDAEKRGHKVLDIKDKKVTEKEFASRLDKMKPELCVLNGHGNTDVVCGHNGIPILNVNSLPLIADSIFYARSCSTGANLGTSCIDNGAKAYIGYKEPFWLCYDIESTHHPLQDEIAKFVLVPSNQVVVSLLKGNSAGESSKRSKDYSRRMMKKLMSSDAPDGASSFVLRLGKYEESSVSWRRKSFNIILPSSRGTYSSNFILLFSGARGRSSRGVISCKLMWRTADVVLYPLRRARNKFLRASSLQRPSDYEIFLWKISVAEPESCLRTKKKSPTLLGLFSW